MLCLNYDNGGICFPDLNAIETGMKVTWVKRLLSADNNGKWKCLVKKYMSKFNDNNFWYYNIQAKNAGVHQMTLQFWRDVIGAWCTVNFQHVECIKYQYIWNNSNIRTSNSTLYYADWEQSGIKTVTHLLNEGSSID